MARHFGTKHHEVVISEQAALEFLPKLVYHQDEPLADPVCMPLYFVCGLAREHDVPVVLAGEGSDELFWGYGAYSRIMQRERWLRAFLRVPRPVRAMVAAAVRGAILGCVTSWRGSRLAGRCRCTCRSA